MKPIATPTLSIPETGDLIIEVHIHMDQPATDAGVSSDVAAIKQSVASLLTYVQKQGESMSQELDDLQAQVANETTVNQSAITLLNGLAAQLTASAGNPTAIKAIADNIKANSDALAAAVTANTPTADTPATPPVEPPTV